MSQNWKESPRKGSKTTGKDTDALFSELEAKFLAIARSASTAQTIPRRAVNEIESLINKYYERWKK